MAASTSRGLKTKARGPLLEETSFDVIVLGTGLVEAMVAAAAARLGKRVLHLDRAAVYGGDWRSLSLGEVEQWASGNDTKEQETAAEEEEDWRTAVAAWRTPLPSADTDTTTSDTVAAQNAQRNALRASLPPMQGDLSFLSCSSDTLEKRQPASAPARTSTFSSQSMHIPVNATPIPERLKRRFCIDLSPRLLFSGGAMVKLLIRCGVARYIEFQGVNDVYLAFAKDESKLRRVPVSRTDVFRDRLIGMHEKRSLMKLIRRVLPPDGSGNDPSLQDEGKDARAAHEAAPLVDFLSTPPHQLTPRVRDVVMYAIARIRHARETQLPARDALARMRDFASSLGMYGPGAFLACMYGVGELPQAFARLCAVNAGIYLLRMEPRGMVWDGSGAYVGMVLETGQFVRSRWLVSSLDYLSPSRLVRRSARPMVLRCVCVATGVLPCATGGEGEATTRPMSLFVLPPDTVPGCPHIVQGLQFGPVASVCPTGYTLVHLSMTMLVDGTDDAETLLRPVVEHLFADEKTADDARPSLLWSVYYAACDRERIPVAACDAASREDAARLAADSSVSRVFVCGDMSSSAGDITVDAAVQAAEAMFTRMFPGEPFLPAPVSTAVVGADADGDDLDDLDVDLDDLA